MKYIELENYLSDLIGIKVDLVMRDALKPRIGERILSEVVPLWVPIENTQIHGYFGVNTEVVWKTATKDLPELEPKVRHILEEMEKQ